MLNPIGIDLSQRSADGGYIRQFSQLHQPQHDGIVFVIIDFAQSAKSQNQVHDQEQHHQMTAEDGREVQMGKAQLQPLLQLDALEELLKNQQPRKRCQLLVLETKYRNFVEFCRNLCFTGFYLRWPPGCGRLFWKIIALNHIPRASAIFFYFFFNYRVTSRRIPAFRRRLKRLQNPAQPLNPLIEIRD